MAEAAIDTEMTQQVCTQCMAPQSVQTHFCSACGSIQPVASGTDFFSFLGLPRKLRLDETELEKSFYALSRLFHPDYFMGATEAEQRASTERSSMLNVAYRTLRNGVARVQYLLSIEGRKEAEKKAPPDLLEEVFELNMQIEELKTARRLADENEIAGARSSLEDALAGLRAKLATIDEQLVALSDDWDSAFDRGAMPNERESLLDRMSEVLAHRSYIRNLVRDIEEVL